MSQGVAERHRVYSISVAMRDMLIEHLDGVKVPFTVFQHYNRGLPSVEAQYRITTSSALIMRGLIRKTRSGKYTVITHDGRLMLSKLLADYAETLIKAHQILGNPINPIWLDSLAGMFLVDRQSIFDRKNVVEPV